MYTVAVNGIPRSGSTLVSQLVRGVLGLVDPNFKLIQTHPGVGEREEVDHTFITIRHPYDVAASRYRIRLSRSPEAYGLNGLRAEMSVMFQHYAGLKNLYQLPHTVLRYEKFYQDYDIIFMAIENAFNMRLTEKVKVTSKRNTV